MAAKPLAWVGRTLEALRAFPDEARKEAGYQLWRVQTGMQPTDWKPMPMVSQGVAEIRIHTEREHRIIYIAKFDEAVYVLHAFEKRARKTLQSELDLTRQRLKLVLQSRRERKEKQP